MAFLTINESVQWEVVRYEYDINRTIEKLEELKPPFHHNLINTITFAEIRNDN